MPLGFHCIMSSFIFPVQGNELVASKTNALKRLIIYKTLLHLFKESISIKPIENWGRITNLMNTSPSAPFDLPSWNSSVLANYVRRVSDNFFTSDEYSILTWRFMYASVETKKPRYSSPHFSLTAIALPVKSCKKGFGFTGATYK